MPSGNTLSLVVVFELSIYAGQKACNHRIGPQVAEEVAHVGTHHVAETCPQRCRTTPRVEHCAKPDVGVIESFTVTGRSIEQGDLTACCRR